MLNPRSSLSLSLLANVHAEEFKGKAWSGLEGSRKLGFPDFMTTTQGGGKDREIHLVLISVRR